MKKIIMTGAKQSKVVEVEKPIIKDYEILVKVKYVGLCHSEYYPWSTAKEGNSFGHEPMGYVAEVGKGVEDFKVGDRVACLSGGMAEYVVSDPKTTVHIPDEVSDEDGVMEPLACLMSVAARTPIAIPGNAVGVVGAGYMGLGLISLLKLKGAGKIVVIDPRPEARENALKYGATEVYSPDEIPEKYILNWNTLNQDLTDVFQPLDIFKQGLEVVVDFTGTEEGLRLAGEMVCAHGYLGVGGYHNDCDRTVDFKLWNFKGMMVENLHERRKDFLIQCGKNALDLLASGQWNFKGVARHIYSMDEVDKGFMAMEEKPEGFIKGLVRCSD